MGYGGLEGNSLYRTSCGKRPQDGAPQHVREIGPQEDESRETHTTGAYFKRAFSDSMVVWQPGSSTLGYPPF